MNKYSAGHNAYLRNGASGAKITGTESELVTFIYRSADPLPLHVLCFGITHPNPQYAVHRDCSNLCALEYIVSGKGYVRKNGVLYNVQQGDVCLHCRGDAHDYGADAEEPYEKYWVNFVSPLFDEAIRQYNLTGSPVFHRVDLEEPFRRLFALENVSRRNEDIYRDASSILFDCLIELSRSRRPDRFVPPVIAAAREKIDENIFLPLDVEALAAKLFLSKSQLTREFKRYYGASPYRYYTARRLEIEKQLLSYGTESIREIAERLHYNNEHYFSTAFRQKTGVSPHVWRKNTREEYL